MSEYKMKDLIAVGSWTRRRENKIAMITMMFQSGQVRLEIAKAAIIKLSQDEDVIEIETTTLAVKPLDHVTFDHEIRKSIEQADADRVKAQGLTPGRRPTM